eukprot:4493697-Pleurochrysis_carterae.AAC.3
MARCKSPARRPLLRPKRTHLPRRRKGQKLLLPVSAWCARPSSCSRDSWLSMMSLPSTATTTIESATGSAATTTTASAISILPARKILLTRPLLAAPMRATPMRAAVMRATPTRGRLPPSRMLQHRLIVAVYVAALADTSRIVTASESGGPHLYQNNAQFDTSDTHNQ